MSFFVDQIHPTIYFLALHSLLQRKLFKNFFYPFVDFFGSRSAFDLITSDLIHHTVSFAFYPLVFIFSLWDIFFTKSILGKTVPISRREVYLY